MYLFSTTAAPVRHPPTVTVSAPATGSPPVVAGTTVSVGAPTSRSVVNAPPVTAGPVQPAPTAATLHPNVFPAGNPVRLADVPVTVHPAPPCPTPSSTS